MLFLLEGNTLIQNKLVMAHVLAHCDFFKNNVHFQKTSRQMVESMAVAAERFRDYEFKYGQAGVESFIDAAMAIQVHVEPEGLKRKRKAAGPGSGKPGYKKRSTTPYDDLWSIGKNVEAATEDCVGKRTFPGSRRGI
ncbi:MAG: SpoVR family protein [Candidatus Syntrophopropionicum ammoniitolerans]